MALTSPAYLHESQCWKMSGVRTGAAFFGALAMLVPDATHVFLEGSPAPQIQRLLTDAADDAPYAAPVGTLWSWPQKNRRFCVRASPELLVRLSDAASHVAEPEICDHLHVYRGLDALLQWFDAFSGPILVSKSVARDQVERFAAAVGGAVSEGTD
jgi:hypothetical protein